MDNRSYGCWSAGSLTKRGEPNALEVGDGYHRLGSSLSCGLLVRRTKTITTQWLPIACGHIERATDPQCDGCARASA